MYVGTGLAVDRRPLTVWSLVKQTPKRGSQPSPQ